MHPCHSGLGKLRDSESHLFLETKGEREHQDSQAVGMPPSTMLYDHCMIEVASLHPKEPLELSVAFLADDDLVALMSKKEKTLITV